MYYIKLYKLKNKKNLTYNIVVTDSKGVNKGFIYEVLGKYKLSKDRYSYILELDFERLILTRGNNNEITLPI